MIRGQSVGLAVPIPTKVEESREFSPWMGKSAPQRILAIRFQAVGDVLVTLPACAAFRRKFPSSHFDLLTSESCAGIHQAVRLFDGVHSLPLDTNRWTRASGALALAARLRRRRYDVILDLQRHRMSRLIRRIARPLAWGEFDRFSPSHALDRVMDTFHRTGFPDLSPQYGLELRPEIRDRSLRILLANGWDGGTKLVILNPAGLWPTRNWPLLKYEQLAAAWIKEEPVKFLFLGTARLLENAGRLCAALGPHGINLVGRTSIAEVLGIIHHASVVISEDSGLLHMAWVCGIPAVALLGSTRSDWTRPLGIRSRYVGSEDLPCGACMEATCRFGDVHCLNRYSAEMILRLAHEAEGAQ